MYKSLELNSLGKHAHIFDIHSLAHSTNIFKATTYANLYLSTDFKAKCPKIGS